MQKKGVRPLLYFTLTGVSHLQLFPMIVFVQNNDRWKGKKTSINKKVSGKVK